MGGTVLSVPGVRKRHLTGDELELAAGRKRHPDLPAMQARWEAEHDGTPAEPAEQRQPMQPAKQQELFR